jgi:hypothetical protein
MDSVVRWGCGLPMISGGFWAVIFGIGITWGEYRAHVFSWFSFHDLSTWWFLVRDLSLIPAGALVAFAGWTIITSR